MKCMTIQRTPGRVVMTTFLTVIFGLSALAGSSANRTVIFVGSATHEIFVRGNPVASVVSTITGSRLR
jgi:hypothetical protein